MEKWISRNGEYTGSILDIGCGRASGSVYENPPGRLEEIRRKYAGGITEEIMSELEQKLKNGF